MGFDLIVVGCASLDTIHVEKNGNRVTHETIGGAGLYTALAAAASGARVVLFAPKPKIIPQQLQIVQNKITWLGPECEANDLPRLEIVHHGGGRATLLNANWGAESLLHQAELPDVTGVKIAHIAALSSAPAQQHFLDRFRSKGSLKVSVGTYARLISQNADGVMNLLQQSDFFFMNANEFRALSFDGDIKSGKISTVIFITDAENGATIYSSNEVMIVQAPQIEELDPTGAGDTFCGSTLAGIFQGQSYEQAAEHACRLASKNVASIGPTALLERI